MNSLRQYSYMGTSFLVAASAAFVILGLADGNKDESLAENLWEAPEVSLSSLAKDYDAVIAGTELSQEEPKWNSSDGRAWAHRTDGNYFTAPMQFTASQVRVDSLIWTNSSDFLHAGDLVTVWTVTQVKPKNGATQSTNLGVENIYFLKLAPLAFEDGYTSPRLFSHGASTVWPISSGAAQPIQADQSAELRAAGASILENVGPETVDAAMLGRGRVGIDDLPSVLKALRDGRPGALTANQSGGLSGEGVRDNSATRVAQNQSYEADRMASEIESALIAPLEEAVEVDSFEIHIPKDPGEVARLVVKLKSGDSTNAAMVAIQNARVKNLPYGVTIELVPDGGTPESVRVCIAPGSSDRGCVGVEQKHE